MDNQVVARELVELAKALTASEETTAAKKKLDKAAAKRLMGIVDDIRKDIEKKVGNILDSVGPKSIPDDVAQAFIAMQSACVTMNERLRDVK